MTAAAVEATLDINTCRLVCCINQT